MDGKCFRMSSVGIGVLANVGIVAPVSRTVSRPLGCRMQPLFHGHWGTAQQFKSNLLGERVCPTKQTKMGPFLL